VRNIFGRGAMLGIELGLPVGMNRFLREMLCQQPGYFAASYLLHRHSVRILPTMSAPSILRVEPSAYLPIEAMDQLVNGLRDYCQRIKSSDAPGLLQHLAPRNAQLTAEAETCGKSESRASRRRTFRFSHELPAPDARRVGFIFNPIYPSDELLVEMPELLGMTIDQRMELAGRLLILRQLHPIELFSKNLFGNRVWLCGIMLPAAPESLDAWNRKGDLRLVRLRLDEAFRLATERGCQTVVFGAQTSVVTANATSVLSPPGIQVSSGNTFTVAVLLSQLEAARRRMGIPKTARLAVVGANGNIGSAIVRWFAQPDHWNGSILITGRAGSLSRLATLQEELVSTGGNVQVQISDNKKDLRSCDVIIVAVSGDGIVLQSHHVDSDRPILLADVSQPRAVSGTMSQDRPNVTLVQAGLVRLPDDRGFHLTPHTPRGMCLACVAEGLLMGLEPHPELRLHGEIDPNAVEKLLQLGRKFGLIDPPCADR
jgi:predicted amino acid dehydrogenase